MKKPHPFMHIVSEDEQYLAELLQPGDVVMWASEDTAGEGVVVGRPGQNWRDEWIVSLFDGEYAIPTNFDVIVEVYRGAARLWPAPAKQLRLF